MTLEMTDKKCLFFSWLHINFILPLHFLVQKENAILQKALYMKKNQTFGKMLPGSSEFKFIYLSQLTERVGFEFCYWDLRLF